MSAKDLIHEPIKDALIKAGWTITHDPLSLEFEDKRIYIDLGAERSLIGAERAGEQIAVEIKSFTGPSTIQDLKEAFGQYQIYLAFLKRLDPKRTLYLATSDFAYTILTESAAVQMLLDDSPTPLIIVNLATKEIIKWKN
jgi:hypothetical protein